MINDFFVVLALQVLDGFDQHYQASVRFPLTSPVNKPQQHQKKCSGILRIEPGATSLEAAMLPLCYAAPLLDLKLKKIQHLDTEAQWFVFV